MSDDKKSFKSIPNFSGLQECMVAYEASAEYYDNVKTKIRSRYKDEANKITTAPIDFLRAFIYNQASLYTNDFKRSILFKNQEGEPDFLDIDQFNDELTEVERLFHLFRRAGAWIYTDTQLYGTTKIKLQALSPTEYYYATEGDNAYFFLKVDNSNTLLYIANKETRVLQNGVIYEIAKDLPNAVMGYDLNIEPIEQYGNLEADEPIVVEAVSEVSTLPFVEIVMRGNEKAEENQLLELQDYYIKSISWGLYTAESKLIHTVVVGTNMDNEELQQNFANFGKSDKIIKVKVGDNLNIFDTGNIDVLMNVVKIFRELVSQKALQAGVDVGAILPQDTKVESGEARAMRMSYRNDIRKQFFHSFKAFEQELWDIIGVTFGVDVTFLNIEFKLLQPTENQADKLDYAIKMRDNGFFNQVDAYAYLFGMSYDEAEGQMQAKGLISQEKPLTL